MARHGEIGRGRDRVDNVNSNKGGNSAEYLAGLLKRDHPDIAAAIITLPRKENATAGNLAQRKKRHRAETRWRCGKGCRFTSGALESPRAWPNSCRAHQFRNRCEANRPPSGQQASPDILPPSRLAPRDRRTGARTRCRFRWGDSFERQSSVFDCRNQGLQHPLFIHIFQIKLPDIRGEPAGLHLPKLPRY